MLAYTYVHHAVAGVGVGVAGVAPHRVPDGQVEVDGVRRVEVDEAVGALRTSLHLQVRHEVNERLGVRVAVAAHGVNLNKQ